MFPTTVQLNVKASPRQVGRTAVNCLATSPGGKWSYVNPHDCLLAHQLVFNVLCQVQNIAYKTITTDLLYNFDNSNSPRCCKQTNLTFKITYYYLKVKTFIVVQSSMGVYSPISFVPKTAQIVYIHQNKLTCKLCSYNTKH